MTIIKSLLGKLASFLTRRLLKIGKILIGIFMILMGGWFVMAPVTQQFFAKQEAMQDAPFLWLIVPVGIVQILIGASLLRPLFQDKSSG